MVASRLHAPLALFCAASLLAACGSDDGVPEDGSEPDTGPVEAGTDAPGDAASDGGADAGTDAAPWPPPLPPPPDGPLGTCADEPPAGAEMPDPPPTYDGECPELSPGWNTIDSGGFTRRFILVAPEDYDGSEELPLIFLWHWLGGDAEAFVERSEAQEAANVERFIAVSMQELGDRSWPYLRPTGDEDVEREAGYFDDVFACVAEQYAVDTSCVSSVGVSAGALWQSQLAPRRSNHLASFVSLSGGVGTRALRDWIPAEHAMPALVLWGGPDDRCIVEFEPASINLERELVAGDHFVVECIHDCGHSVPPFEAPAGEPAFSALWDFVLEHPYWLEDEESPWLEGGMPDTMPDWCAIGPGRATIRSGECGPDACM